MTELRAQAPGFSRGEEVKVLDAHVQRVMLLGDTHGNTGTPMWMHQVFDRARRVKADRILQLGDFGVWPGQQGGRFLDLVDER
jgi:hypothetical protein